MLGSSLGIAALQTSELFSTARDPVKLGSAHPRNAPYRAFQARDGNFAMAAGNDKLWRAACDAMGRPDLAEDVRFASTALRAPHQSVLKELLEDEFTRFDCPELLARFAAAGVPCAPINSYSQVLSDAQVEHMGWVQTIALPGGGHTQTFASPLRISGAGLPITRNPPALGEHTAEVLAELAGERQTTS